MWILLYLVVMAASAGAVTRHVPVVYPTIQSALNAVGTGDTILVEVDTYAEELTAPPLSFVMCGNVDIQPGDYPRPVIDPSTLTNPRERLCMTIGAEGVPILGQPVIEDFVFRNGAAMYPRSDEGGIINYTGVVLRRCRFDSTYVGLTTHRTPAVLEQCRFINNQHGCLLGYGAPVTATDCQFKGNSYWAVVWTGGNTTLTRCEINSNHDVGHLLMLVGTNIVVQGCTIGPSDTLVSQIVYTSISQSQFINNTFIGNNPLGTILSLQGVSGAIVQGNTFIGNFEDPSIPFNNPVMINISGSQDTLAHIENNLFIDSGIRDGATALYNLRNTIAHRNRFIRSAPSTQSVPAVRVLGINCTLRDNFFDNTRIALQNQSGTMMDAIWNWWGDATGPAHELNPDGMGDWILGDVQFNPWYTDTLFWVSAEEPRAEVVRDYGLSVFPNPFNATTTFSFSLSQTSPVSLIVFNVLGQAVYRADLGMLNAGEHRQMFDASELPSGLYLARVQAGEVSQLQKMVLLR